MGTSNNENLINHKDYNEEAEKLDYTKKLIEKTVDAVEKHKGIYQDAITQAMTEYDHTEGSSSYIDVMINTKFLEIAEKNYYQYRKVRKKPYFARIDFKSHNPEGKAKLEKIYIGKASLYDAIDEMPIVVDWRSPIANVYYEGRIGNITYESETETCSGELLLKRQYTIEDGHLQNFMDIDITTNDNFLQASLEASAEDKLKDIASTIQAEQNRVIRAPMHKPLIVQGAAGSGKTTIALHRIAYFIYTYEETFDPENFMIIAPNNLFINYISDVLPELGVEQVKQTTYTDFIFELIGEDYKLTDSGEKLVKLIESKDEEEKALLSWCAAFKGSMEFKNIIANYVSDLEKEFAPKEDFSLGNKVLISKERLQHMFLNELSYLPLNKRVDELKKSLRNKVKLIKKKVLEAVENYYDKNIDKVRAVIKDSEDRREKIIKLADARDKKLEETKKILKTMVNKYIKTFPKKDVYYYYKNILSDADNIHKYSNAALPEKEVEYLCKMSSKLLKSKKIEFEDCAPLAYLKHKILGFEEKPNVRNVVIDEAQDFSLFQFYALKEILKTSMFTILGDISQGIHSYRGVSDWQKVMEHIFKDNDPSYMTLVQSYRTTVEIMNLANKVIEKLDNDNIILAKPVIRHGKEPKIFNYGEDDKLLKELKEKVESVDKDDFKSIAIICKTEKECEKVKKYLDESSSIDSCILNLEEGQYNAGVILVPCQLAKGLEFDAVFIVTLDETYENNPLDIKLLYVCMTRALHRLYIYSKENTITLLNDI